MSNLRFQLQCAKTAYAGVRYPGVLSAEVMPSRSLPCRRRVWFAQLGFGGGALAAAVVGVILLSRPISKPPEHRPQPIENPRGSVAIGSNESAELPLSVPALPEMPAMPDLWSMPAMPTMPAGLTGAAAPSAPSNAPDMMPLAPPGGLLGFPPMAMPSSGGASAKEPA